MYQKQNDEQQNGQINLTQISDKELQIDGVESDIRIEAIFGKKVALCLANPNWQFKEQAMKFIVRFTEKYLNTQERETKLMPFTLVEMLDGCFAATTITSQEKVIKVFNIALQLLNIIIQSTRVKRDIMATKKLVKVLKSKELIQNFLQYSETTNSRLTNKIQDSMLDIAFQVHEDLIISAVFERLEQLNETKNHKGMITQLQILNRLINSFTVQKEQLVQEKNQNDDEEEEYNEEEYYDEEIVTPLLSKGKILQVVLPSLSHQKENVRIAATNILIEVQKQTGQVTEENLNNVNEKYRADIWQKIQVIQIDQEKNQSSENVNNDETKIEIIQKSQTVDQQKQIITWNKFIQEKGFHKEWTQREIALNKIKEIFSSDIAYDTDEDFLVLCSTIVQNALNENNIQIYLIAVDVVLFFILKVQQTEALLDALPNLIKSIVLHTTDTNTRVRKQSVELIFQIWGITLSNKSQHNISQIIANVLCDSSLSEKSIVGRLGILVKKAELIDSEQDMNKQTIQFILGKDYEQLAQFACQWCNHKNKKVRSTALKLIVEICRINSIDSHGSSFKYRILNFVFGLRNQIRDPLIQKINEVCAGIYISKKEIDLVVGDSQKTRTASLNTLKQDTVETQILPQIIANRTLSSEKTEPNQIIISTIVLPHSEILTEEQKDSANSMIELFGLQLVTCFYSQTWSSRLIAIQKIKEQLNQLDPNRRDAMTAEINKNNLPPELSFKIIIKLFDDGIKDPILKNFLEVLELIQLSLPMYLKYLRPESINREIQPIVSKIILKTSDLKQKIREASINFCLFISHQNQIGPNQMATLVLSELNSIWCEKQDGKKQSDVTSAFGNSNMIISCLTLLSQFQTQSKLVTESSHFYNEYSKIINKALKHSNPQVRKEGEQLFKIMYETFQDAFIKEFKDQKPQIIQKLISESKSVQLQLSQSNQQQTQVNSHSTEQNINMIDLPHLIGGADFLNQNTIINLLDGNQEKLKQLKLQNPKKRLIAIIEIKKIVQQKFTKITQNSALELIEPLSLLIRHLLRDENAEVYFESLNLMKFIVGNLSQYIKGLDLHLMIGQYLNMMMSPQKNLLQNMKTRVAIDKVLVHFAKHQNIGSLVIGKEVLNNIQRLNKSAFILKAQNENQDNDKKELLIRFYATLQMLIQQFSIVLCYQPQFFQLCLETISETMQKILNDEPVLRSSCTQIIVFFYQIDKKYLETGVQQLDFTKKTHLKRIIIEFESSSNKGIISQNQNFISSAITVASPEISLRDTHSSFVSQISQQDKTMTPGSILSRRLSRDQNFKNKNNEQKTLKDQPIETPDRSWRSRQDSQLFTGLGWLERKNTALDKVQTTLPPIESPLKNQNTQKEKRRFLSTANEDTMKSVWPVKIQTNSIQSMNSSSYYNKPTNDQVYQTSLHETNERLKEDTVKPKRQFLINQQKA